MTNARFLLDVNVVVALLDPEHIHNKIAARWLAGSKGLWGTCAFSEAGFLRLATHTLAGAVKLDRAIQSLQTLYEHPRFRFWPIDSGWWALAAPFFVRMYGPKQINDAYLLGLAVKQNGVLVTFDKGIRHLAGERYSKNILVLE